MAIFDWRLVIDVKRPQCNERRIKDGDLTISENDLDALICIIARASAANVKPISRQALSVCLAEIGASLFVVPHVDDDSDQVAIEETETWRLATAENPTHRDLAQTFEAALGTSDPLTAVRQVSTAWASLKARLRTKWCSRRARAAGRPSDLGNLVWADLDVGTRAEVLERIAHLARYHRSFLRRGRPHKNEIDTFLLEIAELYCRATGATHDIYILPHSAGDGGGPSSRFVQFASLALRPYVDPTESSEVAVGNRWKRIKRTAENASEDGGETT